MNKYLESIQNQLKTLNESLDRKQKIRIIILAVLILALIIAAILYFGRTTYVDLYNGLDPMETAEIYNLLSGEGEDVHITQNETAIQIPEGRRDALRMRLASEGYPSDPRVNYDLLIAQSGMGSTSEMNKVWRDLQAGITLSTIIGNNTGIDTATVIVTSAENSPFALSNDRVEAGASVSLVLEDGFVLSDDQAIGIARFIMASAPGLNLENIEIVDNNMKSYDLTGDPTMEDADTHRALELTAEVDASNTVMELLETTFGAGHVKAQVDVTMDFSDRVREEYTVSAPDELEGVGLVVSEETSEEAIRGDVVGGQVGLDVNGGNAATYPTLADANNVYYKRDAMFNYVFDETKEQIKEAKGQITGIKAGIFIDSTVFPDVDYVPDVQAVVANAIGALPENIVISNLLPFAVDNTAALEVEAQAAEMAAGRQAELIRTIILAAAIVLAALLIFLMVRSITAGRRAQQAAELAAAQAAAQAELAALAVDGAGSDDEEQELLDAIASVRDETTMRIEEFIERDPAAAAQLLRGWLTEN